MTEPVSFGKYKLLDRLASGKIADIYHAVTRKADGSEIALVVKQIGPELSRNPEFLARFVDEARLASLLDHPNIAKTYEWGRQGESLFIAMEYVQGTNLASLMQARAEQGLRFPKTLGVYIASEVLNGLAYAHGLKDPYGNPLGLVHRDVSPPNIVISSKGQVKLVDFGLMKAASKLQATLPDVFRGKFSYMAPELIHHQAVDQRADIFSLGVVLYELLAGTKLSSMGAAGSHPPSMVQPDIPAELDRLIARAMAEDLRERPASAQEMKNQLASFLDQWEEKVDPGRLAVFLVDTMSGPVERKEERKGFAFGEATSQAPKPHRGKPASAASAHQSQLAQTAQAGIEAAERDAHEGWFSVGETFRAIHAGGLGKARKLKTLFAAIAAIGLLGLMVVVVVANLAGNSGAGGDPGRSELAGVDGFAGAVQLQTTPEGALVFIDGDSVRPEGQPPRIMGLRAGIHRLKLLYPGYLPWEGDITLEANKSLVVEKVLEERRGNVVITSHPPGAVVYLNGKPVGKTPKTIKDLSAARNYQVVLKARLHETVQFNLEPSGWPEDPGEDLKIVKKLKRAKRRRRHS